MTKVRIGASMAKTDLEVLTWLCENIGKSDLQRKFDPQRTGTHYYGENWQASWHPYGSGWFMDVTFDDPKHATFFTLRWK